MATDYTTPKDEYRALVADRDKLLDGFHAMQQLYEDELKHALSENAKLRELCTDMWSYINAPVNQRNSLKERLAVYDDLADRMRELGVDE